MAERLQLDSQSLRKRHAKTYANFFIGNDLVVSACCVLAIGTAIGHRSRHIRTIAKLPIRFYVGLRKTRTPGEARFGNVSTFSSAQEAFETYPYAKAITEHGAVSNRISEFLREKRADFGVEISILGETARGHGIGFSGTTSAAISQALHLMCGLPVESVGKGETNHAGSVFRLALELDFLGRHGNTFGDNVSLSLSDAGLGLHWSQSFANDISLENLREVKIGATYLNRDGKRLGLSDLPIDACVVFSGLPTKTENIEYGARADLAWMEECMETVKNGVFPDGTPREAAVASLFRKDVAFEGVVTAHAVVNAQTAAHVLRLARDPFDRQAIADLLENVDHHRALLAIAERHSPFAGDLHRALSARSEGGRAIGVIPCYTGKLGGAYAVISESGSHRTAITEAIHELRMSYPEIAVEYANWEDGDSSSGPKIESWPEMGVLADEIPHDAAIFLDNRGNRYLGDYGEILKNEQDCLLLDAVEMKLTYCGTKPTSKDIPSQSVAVEVLSRILRGDGKEIHNTSLPASSYSKDRGLLVSKSLSPLCAFVKTISGKELHISCSGIGSKFTVLLGKTDVRIGLVYRESGGL